MSAVLLVLFSSMNQAGTALAAGANMLICWLIQEIDYQMVKTAAIHAGLIDVTGAVRGGKAPVRVSAREQEREDLVCPACGLGYRDADGRCGFCGMVIPAGQSEETAGPA
ncbi:MAG: hypothetical protein HFE86_00580 [Clostridiales bacterium]|nr:hypothetical protein [Clostridiales bacterium]